MFPLCNLNLAVLVRIAHTHADHKPVQLRFRQQLRTGAAFWILCRHDKKRFWNISADAVHGHYPLFHNLKQRRLRLWRRPVDLVRQKQVAHNCSRIIRKSAGFFLIHVKSQQIRRHYIRRKLDPVVVERHRPGKSYCKRRFSHARHILDQNVASCQNCRKRLKNTIILALQRLFYFTYYSIQFQI